jgi:hypothetical protein
VAISTVIDVNRDLHDCYFDAPDAANDSDGSDIVNPWGGIEALLTHSLSSLFDIPTAHSPMYEDVELMNSDPGVMDPAKAAEGISVAFLHCLFKGLSASPRVVTDPSAFGRGGVISVEDISCLVIPSGCLGLPCLAALHQGIAVIEVRDTNVMRNSLRDLPWAEGQFFQAANYFEAAGMVAAMRAGVAHDTLRRPLHLARGSDILHESERQRAPMFGNTWDNVRPGNGSPLLSATLANAEQAEQGGPENDPSDGKKGLRARKESARVVAEQDGSIPGHGNL